jgi:hypothetical protein
MSSVEAIGVFTDISTPTLCGDLIVAGDITGRSKEEALERAFALIEGAAAKGERCPQNDRPFFSPEYCARSIVTAVPTPSRM